MTIDRLVITHLSECQVGIQAMAIPHTALLYNFSKDQVTGPKLKLCIFCLFMVFNEKSEAMQSHIAYLILKKKNCIGHRRVNVNIFASLWPEKKPPAGKGYFQAKVKCFTF